MNKEQAIAEKKAKMKELAESFARLDESQRLEISRRMGGIRTIEGNPLSLRNTYLLIVQRPKVSLVGGFQQWRKAGRIVRKGEKSLLILCPATRKNADKAEGEKDDIFFIGGNVFDISQTEPLTAGESATLSLMPIV
ncbi:MAG: hypothetical protein EB078_11465 [Proteobacteria bacterium]|nr:hypothetical protein [Pseudomonadota bacterium]